MKAKISLEHPDSHYRGKTGKVFEIKYLTKFLYQYGKPQTEAEKRETERTGVLYIPLESYQIFHEPQQNLIDEGFEEHRTEYPSKEIEYVEMFIDTINKTSENGCHTLIGVYPTAYKRVRVEGKYIKLLDDEE